MVNSLKHSKATKARLSGSWKERKIKLIFTDDGSGIKNSSTKTNGLYNLRERAKRLNANLKLISGEGSTSVSLEMSI